MSVCEHCGEVYKPTRGSRGRFCSRACWGGFKTSKAQENYKNGNGYYKGKKVLVGEYLDGRNRYQYEHSMIATRILGRPLKKNREDVHHINGNKLDNRNRNLLICSPAYHMWLHQKMSLLYARDHFEHI